MGDGLSSGIPWKHSSPTSRGYPILGTWGVAPIDKVQKRPQRSVTPEKNRQTPHTTNPTNPQSPCFKRMDAVYWDDAQSPTPKQQQNEQPQQQPQHPSGDDNTSEMVEFEGYTISAAEAKQI